MAATRESPPSTARRATAASGLARLALHGLVAAAGLWLLVDPVAAHGGSLGADARDSLVVPTWLFLLTGGGAVGASFLLASFVTDRTFVASIHDWHRSPALPARRQLAGLGRFAGLLGLVTVVVVGSVGPQAGLANLAILVVWVVWWAGFTASTYLVGGTWPVLNPWRTLGEVVPSMARAYPQRLGAWPSVVGLLALVWLEVVSPLADAPRLLAAVVLVYTAVTLAGTVTFGTDRWFGTVDPVARVFRSYGRVAPLTWDADAGRLRLRLYGSDLTEPRAVDGFDEVAFVVALLWVTTFDGLVSTPAWAGLARTLVPAGVPAELLYPLALVVGFLCFLGVYVAAGASSRRLADTYRTRASLARWFAPSLLAIAAGYHLAHYLGQFLRLSPASVATVQRPLAGPLTVTVATLPSWFGSLGVVFVLLGHLLAIWVAHSAAYRLFPSRLQAVRSQYPFIAVMVLYTMTSLWVVTRPTVQPPYL
jgi:hypothetical protein